MTPSSRRKTYKKVLGEEAVEESKTLSSHSGRTVKRQGVSESLKTVKPFDELDINQNYYIEELNNTSLSERIRKITRSISIDEVKPCVTTETYPRGRQISKGNEYTTPPPSTKNSRDTPSPEIDNILKNVRHVNKQKLTDIDHLLSTPDSIGTRKSPDKHTMRTIPDTTQHLKQACAVESDDSRSSTPVKPTIPDALLSGNTENENNNKKTRTKTTSLKGLVRARMARLESFEIENGKDTSERQTMPVINKISPSKKTLQLNVKEFTQFKTENNFSPGALSNKNNLNNGQARTLMALRPLEINLNFKLRKKKPYFQKQLTKSLTDITQTSKQEDTKPSDEQILSPKTKLNQAVDVPKGKTMKHKKNTSVIKRPRFRGHASMSLLLTELPESTI